MADIREVLSKNVGGPRDRCREALPSPLSYQRQAQNWRAPGAAMRHVVCSAPSRSIPYVGIEQERGTATTPR
jgi:hypothetical protein